MPGARNRPFDHFLAKDGILHELAGFDEVRNYAGSWEEWGKREDR